MSAGYESLIRITPATSWGTPGTTGSRGMFLFADSASLDWGAQVKERDNKLIGNRESLPDTFDIPNFYPAGEFVFQPRADDILPILMAHFQNVVKSGTGTYQFYRINRSPVFTIGGSNIGTNPYSINVDQSFGNSLITGGTGANGLRFTNCIVEKLSFANKYGDDLLVTVTLKAFQGSRFTFPSDFNTYNNVYGSVSEYGRIADWNGTVTISGEDLDIDGITLDFTNNSADRSRLGKRGWNRFPFSGHWMGEGVIDMELERDLAALGEGTFKNLTSTWLSPDAQGTSFIQVAQPNVVLKPYNIPVNDGNSIVDISVPFRAYPPAGTSGPSSIVTVITGTAFGTNLFGF